MLQVVRAYQDAPSETTEFNLRLLEIASTCINTMGGMLFIACHPDFEIRPEWERAKVSHGHLFYVQFYHRWYKNYEIYPLGLLNVVGYWAETQIFGGVMLFERGVAGSEVRIATPFPRRGKFAWIQTDNHQAQAAYLHPQDSLDAYRLSETQIESFHTLSSAAPNQEHPLPFIPESNAHIIATWKQGSIFKNDCDRLTELGRRDPREGCVGNSDGALVMQARYQEMLVN